MTQQPKNMPDNGHGMPKDELLRYRDTLRGYCLLALNRTPSLEPQQVIEIMDHLENELCGAATPEDALRELADFEFALSDWHC